MSDRTQQANVYVFGHSDAELQRLIEQSRFLGDLTEQVLRQAGLGPGMRVLDIGCGAGDVSFLAASLVGATGSVLGIDKSPEAVALAHKRAVQAGLSNVQFEVADLADYRLTEPVDAIVGRAILMYLPDPAGVLRRLAKQVRPGGVIVFQEMDLSTTHSLPEAPLYSACTQWGRETVRRAGFEIDMGSKLYPTFRRAGLPGPQMLLSARVEAGPDSAGYEYIAQMVRSLLPMMERFGVMSAEVVGIDTLAARLRDEVLTMEGLIQLPALIGAWARMPSPLPTSAWDGADRG
jgi:ubiquinone/menaquinone biosynthesis C-methylase UbiE